MDKFTVYIGLGSNLGDRLSNIDNALSEITSRVGEIELTSSVYCTPPWGFEASMNFYNTVVCVSTGLDPMDLLTILKDIESKMGRSKKESFGYESRIIDLDIIDFNEQIFESDGLILPHPQMHLRKFVLVPLLEIAPEWIHPIFKKNLGELLMEVTSPDFIEKLID